MTFPHERPTLQVGSTTYLLCLSVTPQDEWRLHDLLEGKLNGLNSGERELNIFPEVSSTITSATALGLLDLAKPFTYFT